MKAQARSIVKAALAAARSIDPDWVEKYEAALSRMDGNSKRKTDSLLLLQAEVAQLLGCSRWTVRKLVREGKLKPISVMGLKRYRRSQVMGLAGAA